MHVITQVIYLMYKRKLSENYEFNFNKLMKNSFFFYNEQMIAFEHALVIKHN